MPGGYPTDALTMALNVLTTKEQPEQSRELVEVMVVSKTVLVASSGSSKTGCNVVHVVCACTLNIMKENSTCSVEKCILGGTLLELDRDEVESRRRETWDVRDYIEDIV